MCADLCVWRLCSSFYVGLICRRCCIRASIFSHCLFFSADSSSISPLVIFPLSLLFLSLMHCLVFTPPCHAASLKRCSFAFSLMSNDVNYSEAYLCTCAQFVFIAFSHRGAFCNVCVGRLIPSAEIRAVELRASAWKHLTVFVFSLLCVLSRRRLLELHGHTEVHSRDMFQYYPSAVNSIQW